MSWLVTGGPGFLGVHLLRRLRERGIAARSLDLEPLDGEFGEVESIVGDVRDERVARRELEGVDVLVHAAAALPSGGNLEAVNASATAQLARLARQAGVRRSIFVSSAVVYGILPPPVAESADPRPCEPYGRSKLAAEQAWLAAAPAPLVLRPSAFIGPERLGLFGILFRWIREGRRVYVLPHELVSSESALEAAQRELREEVGGEATAWQHLSTFFSSSSHLSLRSDAWLATGVVLGEAHPNEDERVTLVRLPLEDAIQTARSGGFAEGQTALTLLLAAERLDNLRQPRQDR